MLAVIIAGLGMFVVAPVAWVLAQPGKAEWLRLLTDVRYLRLAGNTGLIALLSTTSAVSLGFLFAYATSRPDVPGRTLFKVIAILPLVSPPFVGGLAFILLFGRRGLVTYGLLGLSGDIYGWHGIWLVQTLAFFPIAYLTLAGVLRRINPTLEQAARDLGARGFHAFRTVTLPLARSTFSAAVVWGTPTSSASMGGTAVKLPSSDISPVRIRSGCSALAIAARMREMPSASEPWTSASLTWMARSAPIPSAVRRAWVTRSGPIETTTTSDSPASLIRSASSRA